MPRSLAHMPPALERAFAAGGRVQGQAHGVLLRQRHAGALIVPSGDIVACDPGFADREATQPFALSLLPGRYPVMLGIVRETAGDDSGDERVAYAMLRVQPQRPVRWAEALRAGSATNQDNPAWRGYTVESGLGCFMDAQAARVLAQRLRADPEYSLKIAQEVDRTFVPTWGWTTLSLAAQTCANLIAFSSGAGEGVYTTFVGYDADDRVGCLVTDFALL